MKCRVFYKADGSVGVRYPARKAQRAGEPEADFLERVFTKGLKERGLEGFDHDDIEVADLPDGADRDKWRGSKGNGIHVDHAVVTEADRRKVVSDELDAEIAKPGGNPMRAVELQVQLGKKDY